MKELGENKPFVSVIIPCRNEEKFIGKCLDSILNQSYPKDKLEILVIDGMSKDGTREVLKEYSKRYSFIRFLNNPEKIVSIAMNIGIKIARGDIIVRVDSHSEYDRNYISKCIEYLERTNADCVGGPMRARGNSFLSKAIAFIHHSQFGIGVGRFHNENYKGYVDTVYLGCYRREVFNKTSLFNERLVRNQDIEFNNRLRKSGGKIFLTSEIISYYYCRSTLGGFWEQNFKNGLWNVYTQKIVPGSLSLRHFVPLIFVVSLVPILIFSLFFGMAKIIFWLILGSYFLLDLFFSIKISFQKGFAYLPLLLLIFFLLHFSYGLGSIWGLLTIKKIKI